MNKLAAVAKAFDRIGKINGTKAPDPVLNSDPIAYEFFVASTLRRIADKRYDAAKSACADAGILGDPPDGPEGETLVHNGVVKITRKVNKGASRLSKDKLVAAMRRYGLSQGEIDEIIEKSSSTALPSQIFSAVVEE